MLRCRRSTHWIPTSYNPIYDSSSDSYLPNNPASILNAANPNFSQAALDAFLKVANNATTGQYELFIYRFGAANATDDGDTITAGAGNKMLLGGPGADHLVSGSGNDTIDFGDGSSPFSTVPSLRVNTGGIATLAPVFGSSSTSAGDQFEWTIAEKGQSMRIGHGSVFQFVPADAGTYDISYTITGVQGDTLQGTATVTATQVNNTVTATISDVPSTLAVGATVTLGSDVENTAGATTYQWEVNGVVPQHGATGPTFQFSAPTAGEYEVGLTVTDANGTNSEVVVINVVTSSKTTTTTKASSLLNPAIYGQTVYFTAEVASAAVGMTPTGSVQFMIDGHVFDTVQLVSHNGAMSATSDAISTLVVGNHAVEADYQGDATDFASTGTLDGGEEINRATLTVTANNATKVYGQDNPAFTDTITGFVNGDMQDDSKVMSGSASLTTSATAGSGVGSYTITPDLGSLTAANYSFVFATGSLLNVTPAPLTVTANDASKVYGAADPTLGYTVSGLVNGDSSATVSGVTLATTTGSDATAGTHAITATGGTAANYTITDMNGTLTVGRAALTITSNGQTKAYGAALPTLTASYDGFVYNETVSNLTTCATLSTSATAASHVAGSPYSITAERRGRPRLRISYVAGTLTVTPAPLTITADNQTKVYGAALPTLTASYTGFVNGDTSASLTTAADA